ncbi:MAG: PH domain-containing protein [Vicinamibacterales bacterium]
MATQVFQIAPAASKALWAVAIVPGIILVLVFGLLAVSAQGSRSATFEVSREGLRLRGGWHGRFIPTSTLRTEQARRVDLEATPELTPGLRTMGTGLPGFESGWFRLRNGERALVYLTDRSRTVYLPTTNGYGILLSPADPDAFLLALKHGTNQ